MPLHEFALKFLIPPADQADAVARLKAAGLPATPGRRAGEIDVQFSRTCDSAREALKTAVADVKQLVPAARCVIA